VNPDGERILGEGLGASRMNPERCKIKSCRQSKSCGAGQSESLGQDETWKGGGGYSESYNGGRMIPGGGVVACRPYSKLFVDTCLEFLKFYFMHQFL
jgi:hypothetical protein